MRISLSVTDFSWSESPAPLAARLAEVARAADDGGLDTLWVADHLLQADPNGTLVSAVTFRPPALLIKAVTTLDVLSGGRAWLGLGTG